MLSQALRQLLVLPLAMTIALLQPPLQGRSPRHHRLPRAAEEARMAVMAMLRLLLQQQNLLLTATAAVATRTIAMTATGTGTAMGTQAAASVIPPMCGAA